MYAAYSGTSLLLHSKTKSTSLSYQALGDTIKVSAHQLIKKVMPNLLLTFDNHF